LYKNHYMPLGSGCDFTMASSSRDDAYERAELGFELAVLKFGAFWSLWPDMDRFEEDDVAPWWEAGLRYVHEILAAEANAAAPRVASKVHLEAHLYTFLESEGSKVYADKLQPHDVRLWSDPSAAFPSFKIWLTRES